MICTTESDQSLELSNAKGSELFLIALVLNRYDIARSPTCCEAFHSVCLVAMTTLSRYPSGRGCILCRCHVIYQSSILVYLSKS